MAGMLAELDHVIGLGCAVRDMLPEKLIDLRAYLLADETQLDASGE